MIDLGLIGLCILLIVGFVYIIEQRDKSVEFERNQWIAERQQLLDRIQSPTFAEYKHQEVKVIKAKNGTDKPDVVIEQL